MKHGFDDDKYMRLQTEEILNRIKDNGDRLYLEFGGKLFDDCHAARVLPGFNVNAKVKLLSKLKDKAEIIITINAGDLARNKIRADYNIDYGSDVMRLIDNLRSLDIYVSSIVITQYEGQAAADVFRQKMQRRGEKVYIHTRTNGYPTDIDMIISDEGYGKNPYIETTRPLVVVTAPGPGSGKLATCLCQLYHEYRQGRKAGYAKFETFPIWNLPLKHPVNIAYEAATADLKDVNMIDVFHLDAYGKQAVNYNRDIEVFPVVRAILKKITGKDIYQSPTDMGVNMAGFAIVDDEACQNAAKMEVIRRYYKASCDYAMGVADNSAKDKIELLMGDLGISITDRAVVAAANNKASQSQAHSVAIDLGNLGIVTGRNTNLLSACSSAVLNAVKALAGIRDNMDLISPNIIEPIIKLKKEMLKNKDDVLSLSETLIALSICAVTSPIAEIALQQLQKLNGLEAHSSCILPKNDEANIKKLGINISTEPIFGSADLFMQ